MKVKNKKYHYFYKITNNINGHFYYGIHSTDDLNDGYMGSGTRLHYAYKKYGIENFSKDIIKFFDNRNDLAAYEAEVVTEQNVLDENCYNCIRGGETFNTLGLACVKNIKTNEILLIDKNDPQYLDSSKYVGFAKGKITVKNILTNEYVSITTEEFHNNREKYLSSRDNHVAVYDNIENTNKLIDLKEFYENRNRYTHYSFNTDVVKDKNGNIFRISKDDPRYISGEFVHIWCGKHHTNETKQKMHETYLKTKHQQGEKNSMYGKCWIHNDKKSISIKKEQLDEYISNGWIKGRKLKFN